MRFLVVNTGYIEALHWLYSGNEGLDKEPYAVQMKARLENFAGVAAFYASNLRKLGCEAWDIQANNHFAQGAWASEHGLDVARSATPAKGSRAVTGRLFGLAMKPPFRYLKRLVRPLGHQEEASRAWLYEILGAQIKHYRPDVLLNHNISLDDRFFREHKPYTRLLVGQHASPFTEKANYTGYDLMISSLPNLVQFFKQGGLKSEFLPFGFEPDVLACLGDDKEPIRVSFIGSLSEAHTNRMSWLNYVCRNTPVKVWAPNGDKLPSTAFDRRCYVGPAWGLDMYRVLRRSKVTLNNHIDLAGPFANNMRLYEATGVGTLLITDWKQNLHEIFEPGKEVVAYRSPEECVELIHYYLDQEDERRAIARAGQERTLRSHTYLHRMQDLLEIVRKYL